MIFNRVLTELKTNKKLREDNKEIAIPFPFKRFSEYIPGIQKGRYFLISASTKIGKSKITDYLFLYNTIEYVINNKTDLDVKILYFTLEMSKEEKIKELICYLLYKYYKINLSTELLSSVFKHYILSNEVIDILESKAFQDLMFKFESRVIFYDQIRNPFGIYKTVREYAHKNGKYFDKFGNELNTELIEVGNESEIKRIEYYKANNPNEYVEVITDHLGLLTPEHKHKDLREAMGDYSSTYCLAMKSRWNYIIGNVIQQAAAQESIENFKLDRLQPSANGLGDNKSISRDCEMMLGLFAPSRYKIRDYEGYDITKLRDNYRELSVILNRNGPAVNTNLFFNGATSYFSELPEAEQFKTNPDLYKKWTIS